MALDIYYKEDIGNAIRAAVTLTVETARMQGVGDARYYAGIMSAAKSLAMAFGIPWARIEQGVRDTVSADVYDLLSDPVQLTASSPPIALEAGGGNVFVLRIPQGALLESG